MKYLKLALFSFICAIMFAFTAGFLQVAPIYYLSCFSVLVCVLSLVIWVCSNIFNRFRYSLNVIMIIIFAVFSVVAYIFSPRTVQIENIADLANAHCMTLVWIVSSMACCLSILTLIARVIFRKNENIPLLNDWEEQYPMDGEASKGANEP